jgi:malate dehydrogenase
LHIAQIGTGRVGRPTAFTIMCSLLGEGDKLTVCDTKFGLAPAFAEELRHVTASVGCCVEIDACEHDEDVVDADFVLISAGEPRTPGVKMTRRDLAAKNGKIVKAISLATAPHNRGAKYIVISNPVDAMAMVCKKYTKADFVISTGTNLESLRFRAKVAQALNVPIKQVQGWVGGEHGDAAIPLWSTTRIGDVPIEEYAVNQHKALPKQEIEAYVKSVSKLILDNIGATEVGPAASFRDITRAIVHDTGEVLPVAAPMKFHGIPEATFVSVPRHLGASIGDSIFARLTDAEKKSIEEAAKAIYETYRLTLEALE